MNPVIEQMYKILKEMPLSRKIAIGVIVLIMAAGFTAMFIWANKTEYKPAYTELTEDDAASVVAKLKELKIPYKIKGGGSIIMVPASKVYDVRLDLAKDGIPKGTGVGYEIFDKTDFGTSEFVQKINRKRALQGELARTIRAFDEVKNARVMIVLPKESVFVEETKLPSASILLELKQDLDEEKVAAIAHLVASAVPDLTPQRITIVDTAGRILFEGKSEEEKARIKAKNLADAQYKYKVRFETNMANRIQSMLERIVGKDKAIVRVTAEMDFSTNTVHEEIYDPLERETKFIRSEKKLAESSTAPVQQKGLPSSVNPVVPKGGKSGSIGMKTINKKNDTVNYELSRMTTQTVKPMAVLKRLSVAAVIDGNYQYKTDKNGNRVRVYVPRSKMEMQQFSDLVAKAMGYNQSRQDQVSMECFPFATIGEFGAPEKKLSGWRLVQKEYGRTIANILLVLLVFLFVIMPIMKTVKGIKSTVEQEALPMPEELDLLEDKKEEEPDFVSMSAEEQKEFLDSMSEKEREEFINNMSPAERAAYLANLGPSEKAAYYAKKDMDKTSNIIKGWISEVEEEEES